MYPVFEIKPLNMCVLSAGGDSISAGPFVRCPQVCDWLHGRCMVSAWVVLCIVACSLFFPPVPWFPTNFIHLSIYSLVPVHPSSCPSLNFFLSLLLNCTSLSSCPSLNRLPQQKWPRTPGACDSHATLLDGGQERHCYQESCRVYHAVVQAGSSGMYLKLCLRLCPIFV